MWLGMPVNQNVQNIQSTQHIKYEISLPYFKKEMSNEVDFFAF